MNKTFVACLAAALIAPALSGCVQETASSTSEVVFVGMMGAPKVLDPAGTRSLDDVAFIEQLFPSLLNSDGGVGEVVPEIAVSAEYTGEFEYTVELKPSLKFSNGNQLTASDVVHSISRIKTINDPNGPAVLLASLESATAVGDTTVVFKPTRAYDQALPALLAGLPGLVVDEDVFPADRLLSNGEVAGSNAFAGPYTLAGYSEGSAARLNPNPEYAGAWGVPQNKGVELRYYSNVDQMMYDSSEMLIDVAIVHHQSLAASTGEATQAFAIDYVQGRNVEAGLLLVNSTAGVFADSNFTDERVAKKVREAFIGLIDETAIVEEAFGTLFVASPGIVPEELGGIGQRGRDDAPNGRQAERAFSAAGLTLPLKVEVSFPESFYGPSLITLMESLKKSMSDFRAIELVPKPLSDSDFLKAKAEKNYDVLFDYHYPLYADPEAFLYPLIQTVGATEIAEQLNGASSVEYRDHLSDTGRAEDALLSTSLIKPLLSAGRHALVRDGIRGADAMFGADGKLVLAALYRTILK